MARTAPQPTTPGDLSEVARMLRVVLAEFPATTARERATARRIEGAAVGLDTLPRAQDEIP